MTGRRERRRKHLLNELKEKRGCWKLKEEALDRTVWRTGFVRGYGRFVRQTRVHVNGCVGLTYIGVRSSPPTPSS